MHIYIYIYITDNIYIVSFRNNVVSIPYVFQYPNIPTTFLTRNVRKLTISIKSSAERFTGSVSDFTPLPTLTPTYYSKNATEGVLELPRGIVPSFVKCFVFVWNCCRNTTIEKELAQRIIL